jgi:phosphoenolpyruvate---glycerone phosphotransferase subunit DhaM
MAAARDALVGIVVVSHSRRLAEGVAELAAQMVGPDLAIEAVGGQPDGTLGTDAEGIAAAIRRAQRGAGVLVLGDLGSAILAADVAIEAVGDSVGPVVMSGGPLVEGAVVAAVQASIGQSLDAVKAAAEEARDLDKGVAR